MGFIAYYSINYYIYPIFSIETKHYRYNMIYKNFAYSLFE